MCTCASRVLLVKTSDVIMRGFVHIKASFTQFSTNTKTNINHQERIYEIWNLTEEANPQS